MSFDHNRPEAQADGTASPHQSHIGFIGLGTMGQPMALNLVRAGVPLLAWNRNPERAAPLATAGAQVASTVSEVFQRAQTIILMLANSEAIDAVLERHTPAFATFVHDHTLVHMGTTAPDYSDSLAREIKQAGGRYVEAPVSGQRKPAETGQLLAMVAGEPAVVEAIRPLLAPMCRESIVCGPVPAALSMKLAVNLLTATHLVGLAEAFNYAARQHLDLAQFAAVLSASPLGSDLLRMKLPKLVERDFSAQAAIATVLEVVPLLVNTAQRSTTATPLFDAAHDLCLQAASLGYNSLDIVAVLYAIEERSGSAMLSSKLETISS